MFHKSQTNFKPVKLMIPNLNNSLSLQCFSEEVAFQEVFLQTLSY